MASESLAGGEHMRMVDKGHNLKLTSLSRLPALLSFLQFAAGDQMVRNADIAAASRTGAHTHRVQSHIPAVDALLVSIAY